MAVRTPAQQAAYNARMDRSIEFHLKQAAIHRDKAIALQGSLTRPTTEFPFYCDDCGAGHSSDFGARACCDDGHP